MDEFVNRMSAQRHVLEIVNGKMDLSEKLFGLSHSSIQRWALANQIEFSSEIIGFLRQISSDLFFIATRSQDPVGPEYKLRRQKIINSVSSLERVLNNTSPDLR